MILLVEDDDDIREDLKFLIERQGHPVTAARHGREALSLLEEAGPPSLAIVDLMMPVMDGWEFCDKLRSVQRLAATPIVLMSGVANLRREAERLRAVDVVPKPVDITRLYALIAEHSKDTQQG